MILQGAVCFIMTSILIFGVDSTSPTTLYNGAQVWSTNFQNDSDRKLLLNLSEDQDIELWRVLPDRVDYLVSMANQVKVHERLTLANLNHSVRILDVQKRVNTQRTSPDLWSDAFLRQGHRLDFKTYPTLKVIDEYLDSLVQNFPSLCMLKKIGKSVENRTIKVLRISNRNPDNKSFVILSGVHGREWASISSTLYITNDIVTKFEEQPDYIKNKDWYIIPVLNPDGFVYSHTKDRLWRKNRRRLKNCYGVDINRNFGTDWTLKEKDECLTSYSGLYPFSEPETIALRDFIQRASKTPSVFIDVHSYGQHIVYPWSGRPDETPNKQQHRRFAKDISESIQNVTSCRYSYGNTYWLIYPATGSALDWVYSTGVTHSYVIEGRDQGHHGFLLPPEEIEDSAKDILNAVRYMAKSLEPDDKLVKWL